MELFGQNGETDFLCQMLLEIPCNAGNGPLLLFLRFRRSRYPLLKRGNLQIVDAGAELVVIHRLQIRYTTSTMVPINSRCRISFKSSGTVSRWFTV